jgi:hypothetical protein
MSYVPSLSVDGSGVAFVTTESGIIVPPPAARTLMVTVDAELLVKGVATAALKSGAILSLIFLNACTIVNGATVGAGDASFYLGNDFVDGINWTDRSLGALLVQYLATEVPGISPCIKLVGGLNS